MLIVNKVVGQARLFNQNIKLMGNQFSIGVVDKDFKLAQGAIQKGIAEIKRIETLLTTYNEESITNQINSNAGINPVQVPLEVFNLINRSIKISELTQGAFDISYGGLSKSFWNFDSQMKQLPSVEETKKRLELINYKNIILDRENSSVYLCKQGMRIGFGGIGKGYAAEMAKAKMKTYGAQSGIVNASGDIATWGHQPNGKKWTIGIANPIQKHTVFSTIEISDMSIATSGNYEKYANIHGKQVSHTINPKTGHPISGVRSITTICTNAEFADALTTPLMVLGVNHGLALVNQIQGLECIIVDEANKIFTSNNIHLK